MDSGRPLCVNSRRSTANVRTRAGANRGWGPIRCTWGNNKPDRTKTQQKISQVHGYKSRPISRNLAEISIAYVIGKREAPPRPPGIMLFLLDFWASTRPAHPLPTSRQLVLQTGPLPLRVNSGLNNCLASLGLRIEDLWLWPVFGRLRRRSTPYCRTTIFWLTTWSAG